MPSEKLLLEVDELVAGYGKKQVLNGVSINVASGEIVALIGHNGSGKSTLLKTIFSLLPAWKGQVYYDGDPLRDSSPANLLRSGVAYVPQGNRVLTDLTVRENLEMGGITLPNEETLREGIERALSLFPALRQRLQQRAGILSGGEKQMLALANALILCPRLLLLDEPSLGLAPTLVNKAFRRIEEISREKRVAILIVEQKVREVLKIAHRVYVLRNGLISFAGSAERLDESTIRTVYW